MQRYFLFLFFVSIMLLIGCSNPAYESGYAVGPDEFIMDSYKIRQGKYAILEMEGKTLTPLSQDLLNEETQGIKNGDILNVALYHPTRKDLVATVEHIGNHIGFIVSEGSITLPDIGQVKLEGLTLQEARLCLEGIYKNQISGIEVFISFKDRLEQRVEIIGQVTNSSIIIDGKTRLFDVLAKARLGPDANLFKSYIVRLSELLPVDINRLIKEGDMSQNIVMKGGDKIYIAEGCSSTVMILGEVMQKGLINLPSGYISIREAIAKAGGIAFTGDKGFIQVIRGNIIHPKIYTLNWKHIIEVPTESMLLMPGDIVYIAATPITEWNRFISQLFPSFTAIDWFGKATPGVLL